MSGGLMSGGRMSGGRLSGGLKSYDRYAWTVLFFRGACWSIISFSILQ